MIGRCLEIRPVSADSWFVIGISAPGYCINRCNGSACKITGNHSKACRTASAAGDGTPAVWNVSIVCLEIVWNLHTVCGIAATTGSNLVIPKDMIHIFFITIHELGFRYIETEINAYQKWNKEDKICLFQQIDEAFEYYISSRNRGQLWVWKFYNDMLEGFVADYLPFFPCKAGLVSLFVTVKGELYPCIETGKKYMIGSVDKGLDAEYIRKIIKIEKTQNTRCLQCKEYKENKCRICSCLFGNYENTGNCYIPSEINCELTRHVNNIFREKYSEEQVAMLRKHYRREL